jgi:hypothetical protein
MARNVAKAGAAKGGSCKGVFQARVKDAIRLRNMIWQQTWPGKWKIQKVEAGEAYGRQAWAGTWQKQVRQRLEGAAKARVKDAPGRFEPR